MSMYDELLLSIYIPTYNRRTKLEKQLFFLKNEIEKIKTKQIEIVVNDNCSSDDTYQFLEMMVRNNPYMKCHRNDTNLGIAGNAYMATELTRGKFVWTIGDDDLLQEGIVKHVYHIISTNSEIRYVFLNYADIMNQDLLAYKEQSGIFQDGATMIIEKGMETIPMLFLTSSNVHYRQSLQAAFDFLPLTSRTRYGVHGYASLASIKSGMAFFDKKLWVYNDSGNMSWKDIIYESNMGTLRMFAQLNKVGYTKAEIKKIYNSWITTALVGGKICRHLSETGNIKQFVEDYCFCLKKAPKNVIAITWKLSCGRIKRMFVRTVENEEQ